MREPPKKSPYMPELLFSAQFLVIEAEAQGPAEQPVPENQGLAVRVTAPIIFPESKLRGGWGAHWIFQKNPS